MNQRLEGWKLAAAIAVPLAIIAIAAYLGARSLADNSAEVATGPAPTPVVLTQAFSPDDASDSGGQPTAIAIPNSLPTALPVATAAPTVTPLPTAAAQPTAIVQPTAVPQPTSAPLPTSPPLPTATVDPNATVLPTATVDPSATVGPTATVDPNATPGVETTLRCLAENTIPSPVGVGDGVGPFRAETVPPSAIDGLSNWTWTFGTSYVVRAPNTGLVSWDAAGTYPVAVTAADSTGRTYSASCGSVTVEQLAESVDVSCSVSTQSGNPVADAQPGDPMRVTVTWVPGHVKLWLQFQFETNDPLVIVDEANSGATQVHNFTNRDSSFEIFWRNDPAQETGTVICPAFP